MKVVDAGRHEFFREPTPEERAELAGGKFEECERHAVQVRAAELKRKRLAAKRLAAKKKKFKHTRLAAR